MKLRQIPEDFVVEELPGITILDDGPFSVYLLEKKNCDTMQALRVVAQTARIPMSTIGYAGLKDTHAMTKQYITLPATITLGKLSHSNVRATKVGASKKPLEIGMLGGNRFTITVRDLRESAINLDQIKTTLQSPVPNYFDSQRFGSFINHEFIGKLVLLGNFEKAVQLFLCFPTPYDSAQVRQQRKDILRQWANFGTITTPNSDFQKIIFAYAKKNDWIDAYCAIPRNEREIHLSAFQSFLWNECVKSMIMDGVEKENVVPVKYAAGTLLFFKNEPGSVSLPQQFPLLAEDSVLDETQQKIVNKVLAKQRMQLSQLKAHKKIDVYLKEYRRDVLITPTQTFASAPKDDDLNAKKKMMTLRFVLPKGSYASIVLKNIDVAIGEKHD